MMSPYWLLLVFAFAAKASSVLDIHYYDLEELHNELEDYVTGLQKLEADTKETLQRVYDLEESRALAKHKENSQMILKLANQKKCQLPTLLQLNEQSDSWSNRIGSCMNLTQSLVFYENVTAEIYFEYLEARPLFCAGANTIALCTHKAGSILDRLMCAYDGVQSTVSQFSTIKTKVVDTVKYLQNLFHETSKDLAGCFGIQHTAFLSAQSDLIKMSC